MSETPRDPWHVRAVPEVARELGTDIHRGLTEAEARHRLETYGPNRVEDVPGRPAWAIAMAQFTSIVVLLLVAAAGVAFFMGDAVEAVAILAVLLINAAIGFTTEWRAEQALSALRKQAMAVARVVRDATERQVTAAELVPGDLVILTAGARVPADGRIVEAVRLRVEESALTGESQPITKSSDPVAEASAALGDRKDMAFLGTTVGDGRGRMLVTATGAATEMGQIGKLVAEAGTQRTPLEQRLDQLGRRLVVIVLALCAVIVVFGLVRGIPLLRMIEVGISLAVAAVPEGLPAVATMTLALGMQRMARKKALIRRLPAVEALGSVTVIGTDKTGTLTRDEMTVQAFVLDNRLISVTGSGYSPVGEFRGPDDSPIDPPTDRHLILVLRAGLLCNDARIDRTDGSETALGDPTEAALIVAAEKAGLGADEHEAFPRIAEIPFDSHTKRMITVHRSPEGGVVAFAKGSPGTLLDRSVSVHQADGTIIPLKPDDRARYEEANHRLAGSALRVLGLAYRELPDEPAPDDLDRDWVFLGLVGMMDPLREEAHAAVATCREAGIRTVMITGDQPATAAEIGRQLGLGDGDAPPATVHARELEGLDDEAFRRLCATATVFARVSPRHKLRIVEAMQQNGAIVAMTGDGVNDAPALKKANVGVAMGIKGTDAAKEASAMIVLDDNYATIVAAVEQGRIIYANILRFIHYLFSCNFAEILTVFVALLLGWPVPLGAVQILWLNVVTDVFPALALALEPSSPGMMKRPPRNPHEGLVSRRFLGLVAWQGAVLAAATLAAFALGRSWYADVPGGEVRAGTIAFSTLALAQVAHAFSARSQHRSIFDERLFSNGWLWAAFGGCLALQIAAVLAPPLRQVLHTTPLSAADWTGVAVASLAPVAIVELVKLVAGRHHVGSASGDEVRGASV